ncbi:MAG: hypothetical protein HY785_05330 [Oscillatoriophycideae cyanobacterium NC_groundwater_1537_Pr4_S-0.65um_50_18]|nr:hypothetical protein [Oscillatoriophycideae cyanobacterium NC_groundwater_1537_Pr4_S-0.65um_50_18]
MRSLLGFSAYLEGVPSKPEAEPLEASDKPETAPVEKATKGQHKSSSVAA